MVVRSYDDETHARMEYLFCLTEPTDVKMLDGSVRKIRHQVGRNALVTLQHLMDFVGDGGAIAEAKKATAHMKDKAAAEGIVRSVTSNSYRWLKHIVRVYRKRLEAEYAPMSAKPLMQILMIEPAGNDQLPWWKNPRGVWIQGFIDTKTAKPLLGDMQDIVQALEDINSRLGRLKRGFEEGGKI